MGTHWIKEMPKGYDYYTSYQFDSWDEADLRNLDFDEIWYWYGTAPYEGVGYILYKKDSLYGLHDSSHCSCYGPVEQLVVQLMSAESLLQSLSDGLYKNVKCLLVAAGIDKRRNQNA